MKNLILLLSLLSATTSFAQPSTNFETTFELYLTQIPATNNTTDQWQALSQTFDEIADQYSSEWLAHYYSAFAYMKLAGTYEDQTRPIVAEHLDMAQAAIDKANTLVAGHPEILCLQGFIYVARIWESPYLNGGLYGRKISKLFKQTIEIDPENPRAYYLKGLLTFHTPRFVGGGKEKAKPWLVTAQKKFDDFNFDAPILPSWGVIENEQLLLECGGKVGNL